MPADQTANLRDDLRAALTPRAIVAGVLLVAGPVLAVVFGLFEAAFGVFVASVIVAPNHWFRGGTGDRHTSMENPGGF